MFMLVRNPIKQTNLTRTCHHDDAYCQYHCHYQCQPARYHTRLPGAALPRPQPRRARTREHRATTSSPSGAAWSGTVR